MKRVYKSFVYSLITSVFFSCNKNIVYYDGDNNTLTLNKGNYIYSSGNHIVSIEDNGKFHKVNDTLFFFPETDFTKDSITLLLNDSTTFKSSQRLTNNIFDYGLIRNDSLVIDDRVFHLRVCEPLAIKRKR